MEEKKEWKKILEKFADDIFGTSDFAETPFNNYTRERREKDYDTILNKAVNDIQQELDRAREEVLLELKEEFSEFGVPDNVRYSQPLFYINEIIEGKLSKLKTK